MSAERARAQEILSRLNGAPSLVGAEIGVFGGFLSAMLLRREGMFLYMVDSWLSAEQQSKARRACTDFHAHLSEREQLHYYLFAMLNTEFAEDRRRVLKMDSLAAASHVADGTLDFAFIDADHSYEACKADIDAWLPKVKKGGLLCGHDYDNKEFPEFEVDRAVDEMVEKNNWKLDLGKNFTWFARI